MSQQTILRKKSAKPSPANLRELKSFEVTLIAKDESHNTIGFNGSTKGTIVANGWHPNYCKFTAEANGKPVSGCVTYVGDMAIIEVGKTHRFEICLKEAIETAVKRFEEDGGEDYGND